MGKSVQFIESTTCQPCAVYKALSLDNFWICEIGTWNWDSDDLTPCLRMVRKDGYKSTGQSSSGSVYIDGGVNHSIFFSFQNVCAGIQLLYASNLSPKKSCEVEQSLFSVVCQVESIWIIMRSKRSSVFHPLWANLTSDPRGGSSRQPAAHYSTITFLTAFHIGNRWSVCRQAVSPDAANAAKRPQWMHYLMSPNLGGPPLCTVGEESREISQDASCFRKYSSIQPQAHIYTNEHTFTSPAVFTQTDVADVQLKKFHTCCQNFFSLQGESFSG